jgi:hypothetical protein
MLIIDIRDKKNPSKYSSLANLKGGEDLILSNDEKTVFFALGSRGLIIIDISDMKNP